MGSYWIGHSSPRSVVQFARAKQLHEHLKHLYIEGVGGVRLKQAACTFGVPSASSPPPLCHKQFTIKSSRANNAIVVVAVAVAEGGNGFLLGSHWGLATACEGGRCMGGEEGPAELLICKRIFYL